MTLRIEAATLVPHLVYGFVLGGLTTRYPGGIGQTMARRAELGTRARIAQATSHCAKPEAVADDDQPCNLKAILSLAWTRAAVPAVVFSSSLK